MFFIIIIIIGILLNRFNIINTLVYSGISTWSDLVLIRIILVINTSTLQFGSDIVLSANYLIEKIAYKKSNYRSNTTY